MVWSRFVLHRFVAPDIADSRTADVLKLEKLYPDAKSWLANHFLNSVFRAEYKEGLRQAALAYLRRTTHAYEAHLDARKRTLHYLENIDPKYANLVNYYRAVSSWESFALQCEMALDIFKWMNNGIGAFKKKYGSVLYRIYTIANHVKHTASCVNSGQCSTGVLVPLWLTAAGIQSFDMIGVTYGETAKVFGELAELAQVLRDPLSFTQQ